MQPRAMLTFHLITLFPELFDSFISTSLIAKAIEKKLLRIELYQLRDFADPPHFRVDDTPYGGGGGMVLKPEPLAKAIRHVKQQASPNAKVVYMSPAGSLYKQELAEQLSEANPSEYILLCGRYEGMDQRIIDTFVDMEISIGDYILMGGELAAMVVMESLARLRPEVLGNHESPLRESFSSNATNQRLLEAPHYTKPQLFESQVVPEILLSGDHQKIDTWRATEGTKRTRQRRPDLLKDKTK
jgi:tRNA (guanine37-N1)-methyltransferase